MAKYRITRERTTGHSVEIEASSPEEAVRKAREMKPFEFHLDSSKWGGEPLVREVKPAAQTMTLAVVQIVMDIADEPTAVDYLHGLLDGSSVFDWAYLRVGDRWMAPHQVTIPFPYVEGQVFGYPMRDGSEGIPGEE